MRSRASWQSRRTGWGAGANSRSDRCEVQPFLDALEPLLHAVDARVDDGIVAVQVRDLGLDGCEALLDRCEVVLDLAHVRAYGPKMLENQVFDVVGHRNTPPQRPF